MRVWLGLTGWFSDHRALNHLYHACEGRENPYPTHRTEAVCFGCGVPIPRKNIWKTKWIEARVSSKGVTFGKRPYWLTRLKRLWLCHAWRLKFRRYWPI